jgi:hypothetical protein
MKLRDFIEALKEIAQEYPDYDVEFDCSGNVSEDATIVRRNLRSGPVIRIEH